MAAQSPSLAFSELCHDVPQQWTEFAQLSVRCVCDLVSKYIIELLITARKEVEQLNKQNKSKQE